MPGCALLDFLASLSSDWRPLVLRLFFAARPGHAPVAHKHTSLRGLLLMHINQHGSLMVVTSHSPTGAEDWKIKISFAIKRSLGSWEKHRFQPKGAVPSDFQAAFNFANISDLREILWFCTKTWSWNQIWVKLIL